MAPLMSSAVSLVATSELYHFISTEAAWHSEDMEAVTLAQGHPIILAGSILALHCSARLLNSVLLKDQTDLHHSLLSLPPHFPSQAFYSPSINLLSA
jgi:hypothetical protein